MEKVVKAVKPAYEGFWHQSDSDILSRLNEAAKKLKDRHTGMKQNTIEKAHQQEDQVTPTSKCVTCDCPIGHHLLECSKDTLQDGSEKIVQEVPVEPLTGLPKIVHPFPAVRPQTLLMSPPSVPANFSVRINQVAKMRTSLPSEEAQLVAAMATQPQVIVQKLTPEEIKNLSSSA